MEDKDIKELIIKYQEGLISFRDVEEYLASFIYRFPIIEYKIYNEDLQSEFYLYFIERLPRILLNYKIKANAKFKTYLYLVLRRHYINFIKPKKQKLVIETKDTMDEYVSPDFRLLEVNLDFIAKITSHLSNDQVVFLKLFSPETLDYKDFKYLSGIINCDVLEVTDKVVILFEDVARREIKDKKIVTLASVKKVAEFLGWSPHKVSKKLNNIKKKVQKLRVYE